MELREAVEKAGNDVTEWALQVTSSGSYQSDAKKFHLISYDSAVKTLVVEYCQNLGIQVRDEIWTELASTPTDSDASYTLLSDTCSRWAQKAAFTFFGIGWVMGAPEHQLKPKTRETFLAVMDATPIEVRRILERRFTGEEYLRTRFADQLEETKVMVNQIFSEQRVPLSPESVVQWCAITSSVPAFGAYELAVRARMLIEEEIMLEQMAVEFE